MIRSLLDQINSKKVLLVAVSKTRTNEEIMRLYDLGIRDFGENRVSELLEKQASLPTDIRWHMIGHLQSKKVKIIAPFIDMIHSVDRLTLLDHIEKEALKCGRTINVLLQFKVAQEESKYGFNPMAFDLSPSRYSNIKFCGVMGMASFVNNMNQVRSEFQQLRKIYSDLKKDLFDDSNHFSEISMGMSGDYEIAIEEGASMVRIGSLLFRK